MKDLFPYVQVNEDLRLYPVGIKATSSTAQKRINSILRKQEVKSPSKGFRKVFNEKTENFELTQEEFNDFFRRYRFNRKAQFQVVFRAQEADRVLEDYYICSNEFVLKLYKPLSTRKVKEILNKKYSFSVKAIGKKPSRYFLVTLLRSRYSNFYDEIEALQAQKQTKFANLIEYIHPNFFLQSTQRSEESLNCLTNLHYYVPSWLKTIYAVEAKEYIYERLLYQYRMAIPIIVVDQGIDIDHPEFSPQQFGPGFNAFEQSRNNSPDFPAEDHGTAIAGLILSNNRHQGILGINPRLVQLYNIKIFSKQYVNYEQSAKTHLIKQALETYPNFQQATPRVYNFSCKLIPTSDMLDGLKYIQTQHQSLLVCASGNTNDPNNNTIIFPARLPHTLCVGSVDILENQKFRISDFTCTGGARGIDICAPGDQIQTASTDSKYCTFSGTSFATPLVSGLAAMIWLINPALSPAEVKEIIMTTAQNTFDGYDPNTMGAGVINCLKAVQEAERRLSA